MSEWEFPDSDCIHFVVIMFFVFAEDYMFLFDRCWVLVSTMFPNLRIKDLKEGCNQKFCHWPIFFFFSPWLFFFICFMLNMNSHTARLNVFSVTIEIVKEWMHLPVILHLGSSSSLPSPVCVCVLDFMALFPCCPSQLVWKKGQEGGGVKKS